MDILEAMRARYSVRQYTTQPLSAAQVQREFAAVAPRRVVEIPDVGIDVIVPAVSEHDADRVASRLQIFRDIVNHIPGAEIVIRHDRIEHVIPDFAAVQINFVPPQSANRKFRMFRD